MKKFIILLSFGLMAQMAVAQTTNFDLLVNKSWNLNGVFIDSTFQSDVSSAVPLIYNFNSNGTLSITDNVKTTSLKWRFATGSTSKVLIYANESSTWGYDIDISTLNAGLFVFKRQYKTSGGVSYYIKYSFITS